MATFTTTKRTDHGTITIIVTEGAGDVITNTSPISVTIRYTSAGQYYMGITDFDVVDSLGNVLINSYKRSYGVVSGISKGTVTIKSWSNLTAAHNATDGTGSLSIKISYRIGNSTVYTDNFTMGLAQIPRGSTLTLAASSLAIDNTTGALGYTITSDGDYYHKVECYINLTRVVITGLEVNNTTYSGTIPYSTILQCIPTSSAGTLTVTVYTYADSEMTISKGARSATCTVVISVKPTISNLQITSSISTVGLIAGYSYGTITCSTSKPEGALGVTTYFSITNATLNSNSSGSLTPSITTQMLSASTTNYTLTITAYAIDSRGIRSTDAEKTATVIGYSAPVISCDFYRTSNSSGTPVADESGTYVYVDYDATFTLLYGATQTISATFNGTSIGPHSYSALSETSTATIIITATDNVTSVTQEYTVPVAIFAVDVYDAGGGDIGIAFGGISRNGYNDNFLIGTGDLYYDADNGNEIDLCSNGNVTLMGVAGSTSSITVTVFLPKLVAGTPTITATASSIYGAGTTKTPSTVAIDAYSTNWVRLSVASSSLTQYQIYAVQFSALTITFS